MEGFRIEGNFPAVLASTHTISFPEFLQLLTSRKKEIEALLLKHGALMFRGFPIETASDFSTVIETLGLGNFVNYIGGDSPRDKVEQKVYTSTEAPPSFHIALHQELSFIKHHPRNIYFFCEIEPVVGGETIIADARQVYQSMDPAVTARFADKGLTYTSHYYYRSKIMTWLNKLQRSHKSWTEVFETESKAEVEKRCLANEFALRWLPRDWLEIKQTRPAVLDHPVTSETVWFNQAHLYDFNPRMLGWAKYIGAKLFYLRPSTRLHEIEFADGSPVSRRDIYHVLDVLEKNTVAFPWKKGDVMVLDNVLAMHGRAPFSGKRRILTALTT